MSSTTNNRSTTQIWVVTRHHYGISRVISQMSFCRETVGGIAKCQLFSKATKCIVYRDVSKHLRGLCVFVYIPFGDVQIYLKCLYTVFTNGRHGGKNWCLVMKARRWRINKNCK